MDDLEKEFHLVVYKVYKKPICYWTEESYSGIKVINGLYLFKDKIFGRMPYDIDMKIKFNLDKEKNDKLAKKFIAAYLNIKKNRIYIEKGYYICNSILIFQKICDGQKFYLYKGEYKGGSKIREVYFHRKILGENYPERIPIVLIWKDITNSNDEFAFNFNAKISDELIAKQKI